MIRRRSSWELRPRDLPPEAAAIREPRLRGMENNAAFRLLMRRGRRFRGFGRGGREWLSLWTAGEAWQWVSGRGGLFRTGILATVWAVWLWPRVWGAGGRGRGHGSAALLDSRPSPLLFFTRTETADLILCGVSPSEIVAALWAANLRARTATFAMRFSILLLAAAIGGIVALEAPFARSEFNPANVGLLAMSFFTAYAATNLSAGAPALALGELRRKIENARGRLVRNDIAVFGCFALTLGFGAVAAGALQVGLARNPGVDWDEVWRRLAPARTVAFWTAAAPALGAVLGLAERVIERKRSEPTFAALRRETAKMLAEARIDIFDRRR